MTFDPISAAFEVGGKLIDHFFPNKAEADAARLKLLELQQTGALQALAADTQLAQAQQEINKVEAASPMTFISGWRPFIGWICGAAFAANFVIRPLVKVFGIDLPAMDMATLMPVLLGMLGLGAMRTYEKVQGVASK